MPTAAKLVSAVLFALVAAYAAHIFIPILPEGTQTGWLRQVSAAIGFLVGWQVMGRNVGKAYAESAATGLRASITALFLTLLAFSVYTMILRSTKMLYDGPMEAILGVFDLMIYYGKMMGDRTFLGVLAVGGMISGLIAEFVGRRWK
jgi:hypothetical protein